jgi:hypothetical protein
MLGGVNTGVVVLNDERIRIHVILVSGLEDVVAKSLHVGFCVDFSRVPARVADADMHCGSLFIPHV